MTEPDESPPVEPDEEQLLRSVTAQNAHSILLARRRAEQNLLRAKEALELRTQELARSLALMGATLQATWDGILVTDEDGRVTAFNERFVEMWRVPRDVADAVDRIQDHVARQFADRQAYLDHIAAIHTTAPPESHGVLDLADGRVFEGFSKTQTVDGRPVGRVWTFRDITEHRRAEATARQAAEERRQLLESEQFARGEAERANAMKDEFLATVSHELRTPLNAILGWSHLLRTGGMDPRQLQQGLEVIERNARAQTQLIEDLLDMSRIISGKMRLDIQSVDPVSFIEAAIETVRPAAEAKGIRLSTLLDPGAGPVNGDPSRLQQVVWNLLSNAIKFTGRDGRVQVVLERVNSHIEIAVADTGVGIKPEFLPHVFDRFRQEKASPTRPAAGLGLGLSIVKHLVELHGGSVHAVSAGEAQGATFTVCLPLTVVQRDGDPGRRLHPRGSARMAPVFRPPDLSGITVLVVDDQPDARELIKRVLEDCAAMVLTVGSAGEALGAVAARHPDVLVTDIGMPDVDGYELLRRIRALGPPAGGHLPAIALTAFARSEDRTRALRAGFLAHVAKPVEPSELVAMVASVVGRAGDQLAD
jgi:signal transduction histidine kinase/ActR/RegA family two-component response regulator